MSLDDHISTIQSSLQSLLVNIAMAKLTTLMPLIPTPIRKLIEHLLSKFIGFLLSQAEMQAFYIYTDFRTSRQGEKFYQIALENQRIQQSGSEEEKKLSEQNLINSFNDLVKLTS